MDKISFYKGGLSSQLVLDSISEIQKDLQTGAYNLFLGQVRADVVNGKKVSSIEFTAYEEMVPHAFQEIANQTRVEFPDVRILRYFIA